MVSRSGVLHVPSTKPLFQPFGLGDLELPNRIVMAPLTRNRATHDTLAPGPLNAEYYRQRASAGLIITEATQMSSRPVLVWPNSCTNTKQTVR